MRAEMEENRNKPPAFARYRREAGRSGEEPSGRDHGQPERGSDMAAPGHAAARPSQDPDGPAPGVGGFRPRHATNIRAPAADAAAPQEKVPASVPRRPGVPGAETPSPAMRQNIFARGAQRRAEAAQGPQGAMPPGRRSESDTGSRDMGSRDTGSRDMGDLAGAVGYGRDPRLGMADAAATPGERPGDPGLRGLEQGTAPGVRHILAEDRPRPLVPRKTVVIGVLAALVFGLFGTVVYLGYRQTLGFSEEVPLVRAPDKPYKEPPEAGGGADLASESSNVMGVFSGRGDDARVERIMPRGAPAPMSLDQADPGLRERADSQVDLALLEAPPLGPVPTVPQNAAPQAPAGGSGQTDEAVPAPQAARTEPAAPRSNPAAATPAVPTTPRPQAAPTEPSRPPVASTPPAAAPSTTTPPTTTPMPTPSLTVRPSAPPPVNGANAPRSLFPPNGRTTARPPASPPTQVAALPTPSAPAASASSGGGTWRVQLAAVGSRQAAEDAWRIIRQRNPSVATLPVNYVEAQIGTAHVVRVQAGAFAGRDEAARTCQVLRSSGSDCFVVGGGR